ncbi:hypothetical protein RhiirA5_450245 [Rhizophagus irregularis]|uniref:Uncharacterized protein n=1 Tax=Rhizophagus irregularis TaxID=588596 RepID=A0A2I1E2E1_9GLOM|nr:hypothetical protein RhiirA5_450245 [Rhizophagus irregularis]PKY16303.1 hypothetical protein RhiirB3_481079 [Rhizophagus irregularis]CAB5121822.1 unnamed protein product [Rhizophagus irregularis]CAB5372680.1 unnamed protein product [Rhizophagus irregularis]
MTSLQILLHTTDPSNRLYVIVLDLESHTFFKVKISSPQEIIDRSIERKYKSPLKNAYMIFMTDCSEAFKDAKSEKKFRQNSECFKNFSSLWNISPQEVKDEYERVFNSYRKLKPISQTFFEFHPQNNVAESLVGQDKPSQTFVEFRPQNNVAESLVRQDKPSQTFVEFRPQNNVAESLVGQDKSNPTFFEFHSQNNVGESLVGQDKSHLLNNFI